MEDLIEITGVLNKSSAYVITNPKIKCFIEKNKIYFEIHGKNKYFINIQ